MTPETSNDQVVFETKWFNIVTRTSPGSADPHYVITMGDIASVVAVTTAGRLLLVRQYRPAPAQMTLEIPSGHVEKGETPEQAARKELLEETGYVADKFEFLRTVRPAVGRYTNQMWCYFAADARQTDDPGYKVEAGIEVVQYEGSIRSLMAEKEFCSGMSHSIVLAALARGRLKLDHER